MSKWWDGLTASHEALILEDVAGFCWNGAQNQVFKNLTDQYTC